MKSKILCSLLATAAFICPRAVLAGDDLAPYWDGDQIVKPLQDGGKMICGQQANMYGAGVVYTGEHRFDGTIRKNDGTRTLAEIAYNRTGLTFVESNPSTGEILQNVRLTAQQVGSDAKWLKIVRRGHEECEKAVSGPVQPKNSQKTAMQSAPSYTPGQDTGW